MGAVVPLSRRSRDDQMSNDTEFGLASYLYTRDLGRAMRWAEALDYGIVGVSEENNLHRVGLLWWHEGIRSGTRRFKYGIDEYLELKYILLGGLIAGGRGCLHRLHAADRLRQCAELAVDVTCVKGLTSTMS
ncbi:MAG: aldehyde dehydrogenase family protein [Candidatus Obscuribacterales bacterium]